MTSRKTPAATSSKETNQGSNEGGPAKGANPKGAARVPQFSEAEKAQREKVDTVFKEVEAIRTKITEYRAQISTLETARRELVKAKQEVQKRLRDLGDQRRAVLAERGVEATKLKDLQEALKRKKEDIGKYKDKLTFKNERHDDFVARNLEGIEREISQLEEQMSSRVSLSEEKRIIGELASFRSLRNTIKDFDIKANLDKISEAREALDSFSERLDAFRPTEDSLLVELQAANVKIVENTKKVQAVFARMKAEDAKIDELITKRKKLEEALGELRQKRINDNYELRRKQHADRQAKWEAIQEEKRRKHEDFLERERRRQESKNAAELLVVPYEEELALCDNLLAYLDSIVAQKKTKGELKLKWEVYLSFEHISTVPPKTYAEVEQCIANIKAKKEYYQQLSKQKVEQRRQNPEDESTEVTESEASSSTASEPAEVAAPLTVDESQVSHTESAPEAAATTEGEKTEVPADQ